ncbi:MAG: HNH endonuclease [Bradyrhizobiaceae bacterium]|nr:HNH endonuclease [Bradyrhizobiaceae bacterium]
MRPIAKGAAPRTYAKYGDAQPDLVNAIDRFCSYCERHIAAAIHVEHKRPKKSHPLLELEWSNFLLACPNCNPTKGNFKVRLRRYLWPDDDNTLLAFTYHAGGVVRANRVLPKKLRSKANRTLQMYGLHKRPGGHVEPSDRDYRWEDRRQEWDKAVLFRQQLQNHDTPSQRALVEAAATRGMFSVWWTVFDGDVDMRRRLREAFVGTDPTSFDAWEQAVARPGGQL